MKIHESDYGDNNFHIARYEPEVLKVEITYPGWKEGDEPNRVRIIEVDQESVRASDGIRLIYDYDRDGWVIQQPTYDEEGDRGEEWHETAFVRSWALERPE